MKELSLKLEDCRLCFVNEEQEGHLKMFTEMEKTFKVNSELNELMDYRLKEEQAQNISLNESVEDEDALRLMSVICGGYVEDDFASHLSYNDFRQKKDGFDILSDIYQNVQKKYKNRKIDEGKLKFRSMLLMVYLEENIPKMGQAKLEELFAKNKIVW